MTQRMRQFYQELATGDEFRAWAAGERRGLQADSDVAGGFMLGPDMRNELLIQEQEASIMRAICRVVPPIEGDSMPVPSQEAAMADGEWTGELGAATEESDVSFGRRVLRPHLISKRVKVGKKLLRHQVMAEQWVTEALRDAIVAGQETAFIQGSGIGQPLGLLNTDDLPVYETASSGTVTASDVISWIYSLPARFLPRARVLTSKDFLKVILKTADASGAPAFMPYNGRLANVLVSLTDAMPTVVDASGNLVGGEIAAVVGDFRWYWIGDSDEIAVQRLVELYAAENEDGYQVWQETDGLAVIPTAFYALRIKS